MTSAKPIVHVGGNLSALLLKSHSLEVRAALIEPNLSPCPAKADFVKSKNIPTFEPAVQSAPTKG